MDKQSKEFKELIYDLANGALDLKNYPVPESELVENEYEEGKPCYEWYEQMHDAYERVCNRLGKSGSEDADLEVMVDSLLAIGRFLSMKMYDGVV